MTTLAAPWTPTNERVRLIGKGTPAFADLSRDLAALNPQGYVTAAQGNHHPVYERMKLRLQDMFTFVSRPNPVYKGDPAGFEEPVEKAADFERSFFGAPATKNNTLIVKQQGRLVHGLIALTLKQDYLDENTDAAIMPNLRWRVLDGHIRRAGMKVFDYDETAEDVVASMRAAVDRAGGAEKVGMIYTCSPNNPTGRRFTAEEYKKIKEFLAEVNAVRAANNLKPAVLFCDDPYFEAHFILHRNYEKAKQGGAHCFLETNYHALDGAPVVFMHSFSKFAEQAGSSGISLAVCTQPELLRLYKTTLQEYGGLAYGDELMELMNQTLDLENPENCSDMLSRCVQAGNLFYKNWLDFNDVFGERVIPGQCNMVGCMRVDQEEFMGAIVEYPNGEKVTIDSVDLLVETLGNFYGIGLVAEQDDRQIPAEAYDSENESLIRFAMNDPVKFRQGAERAQKGLRQIAECLKLGTPLTKDYALQTPHAASVEPALAL